MLPRFSFLENEKNVSPLTGRHVGDTIRINYIHICRYNFLTLDTIKKRISRCLYIFQAHLCQQEVSYVLYFRTLAGL